MVTVKQEVREVFEEAVAIGSAHERERKRHRTTNERLMARAAKNVYAAHLLDLVKPNGFSPINMGSLGKEEAQEAASKGQALTARAYGLLIGYSEAYISRLYRLGFGIAAEVLDPEEVPEQGRATRWSLVSRQVGDTPEIGSVLGKDAKAIPTIEALDTAIEKAQKRRAKERAEAASRAPAGESIIPARTGERLDMLEAIAETIEHGRHLTPKQIERVQHVMDELRRTIEGWVEAEHVKIAS